MESKQSPSIIRQTRLQTIGYILTALGLVVGLAWNDAITTLINTMIPLGKDGLAAKFIYAAIITVIVVVVSLYIQKLALADEK